MRKYSAYMTIAIIICIGCQTDFLDKKPDKSLLVPQTITDFQALLDNNSIMNLVPYLPLISSDDLHISREALSGRTLLERNSYIWKEDLYENAIVGDWNNQYRIALYANIVLEGLGLLEDSEDKRQLEGAALFFRAWAHLNLVQQFARPYNPGNAAENEGIPLKLEADVNMKSSRGTLKDSFDSILTDLKKAASLLSNTRTYPTRPVKNAASALLARTYLLMQDYENAEKLAIEVLSYDNTLMDFNGIVSSFTSAVRPFPTVFIQGNPEVIFYAPIASSGYLNALTTTVNPELFAIYDSLDQRRRVFYVNQSNGSINFKGSYSGQAPLTHFAGLANNELYLIIAECQARRKALPEAAYTINLLLKSRWLTGRYENVSFTDSATALRFILSERRKELVFRGLRWSDLRRLNQDGDLKTDIEREFGDEVLVLRANDNKYTFPIPEVEIQINNYSQNPR